MLFKKQSELEKGYDKYAEQKESEREEKVYNVRDRNDVIIFSVFIGIFIIVALVVELYCEITRNRQQTSLSPSEYEEYFYEYEVDVAPELPAIFGAEQKHPTPRIESEGRSALKDN